MTPRLAVRIMAVVGLKPDRPEDGLGCIRRGGEGEPGVAGRLPNSEGEPTDEVYKLPELELLVSDLPEGVLGRTTAGSTKAVTAGRLATKFSAIFARSCRQSSGHLFHVS